MEERNCTVILPTYNEEANIVDMVSELRRKYPAFSILIMDDNSTDRSKELVDGLNDRMVRFFVRAKDDRGLSASIFQGITETETEYFINMDSDFQHPTSAVKSLYEELEDGYDLVIGVRENRVALGFTRWAGSWAFHALASMTLFFRGKQGSKDIMSGLFGGRTEMFKEVIAENHDDFEMRGFKALFDLLKFSPKGLKISEVTYDFGERHGGESKISPRIVCSALRQCGPLGRMFARIYGAVKK